MSVDEEITDPSREKLYVGIIHIYFDEGHNVIVNAYPLSADGTRYSEEFAAFFKETFGYIPCDGPFCGAAVDD